MIVRYLVIVKFERALVQHPLVDVAISQVFNVVVGRKVGDFVGFLVGELVGDLVGGIVGEMVGFLVGEMVGFLVGEMVGFLVGCCVITSGIKKQKTIKYNVQNIMFAIQDILLIFS